MKTTHPNGALDMLIGPLADCLTPESARRVVAMKADRKLQARVNDLAERCQEGLLTPEEHDEYSSYVKFSTFIAVLKSKARQLLARGEK